MQVLQSISKAIPSENMPNIIEQTFCDILKCCGLPVLNNRMHILDRKDRFNGIYYPTSKTISIFISENKDMNPFRYISTVVHETTHLLQDFVISNRITQNNIDSLSLKQYEEYLQKFFKDKTITPTAEMLNIFKNFVKNEPFFANEVIGQLAYDKYLHTNKTNAYYNNLTELMANINAFKYLYDNIVKNPTLHLSQYDKDKIRKVVDKIPTLIEKVFPDNKAEYNHLQFLISPFSFLRFLNYTRQTRTSIPQNISKVLLNMVDILLSIKDNIIAELSINNNETNINNNKENIECMIQYIILKGLNTNIQDIDTEKYEKIKFHSLQDLMSICDISNIEEIVVDIVDMTVFIPSIDTTFIDYEEAIEQTPNTQNKDKVERGDEIYI